jgi:outer membrane protein assembly factor BamD (BamD/ComL family)
MQKILENWHDAHEAFFKLLKWYPGSERFPQALEQEMDLARHLLDGDHASFLGIEIGGETSLGIEILEKFLKVAPFAPSAPEALYRLGNHTLDAGEHDEAVVLFETLVRRFPGSPFRIKAEYQAAWAHFRKFRGLAYDVTALEEALDRFHAFIELHAEDPSSIARTLVGEDRGKDVPPDQRYTGARAWVHLIENLLAEKNYDLGRWYEGWGRTPAARSYYRFTALEYPGSKWAEKATERLEELEPEGE